jgi:hypothetical protein
VSFAIGERQGLLVTIAMTLEVLFLAEQSGQQTGHDDGHVMALGGPSRLRARLQSQLMQQRCACTGGHLTEPYEQNTQQSPALGRSTVWQRTHS